MAYARCPLYVMDRECVVVCPQEVISLRDDLAAKDAELMAARLRSLEMTMQKGAGRISSRKAERMDDGAS